MTGARRWTPVFAAALAVLFLQPSASRAKDAQQAGVDAIAAKVHGVRLNDGERAVLTVDASGTPKVVSRTSAAMGASTPPPVLDTRVETTFRANASPNSAGPDTLVATFQAFGSQGATLRVENGFAHPIIYDAMIVMRRGENLEITKTTICPVSAHRVGMEQWGGPMTGIILSNAREPAGNDMHCSGDSGLATNEPSGEPNVCVAEAKGSPFTVRLYVDPATGERLGASAAMQLRDGTSGVMSPTLMLEFPMQKERVAGRPDGAAVIAVASLDPRPKSKTASIVILADGVEAVRRHWRMYAQTMAAPEPPPPSGGRAVAFTGSIPFPLRSENAVPDPKLVALFAAIGDGRVKQLEVRVEGDDGSVMSRAAYPITPADLPTTETIGMALQDADAKRVAPGHCAKPPSPASEP